MVDTETVNVTANGTYATPNGYALPTSGAVTGTYQWMVTYSGDANNKPVASAMGDEPVAVEAAFPTLSTSASPTDAALSNGGSPTLKDSATLAGGYNPTGTLTFRLYAPDGTTVVDTETVNVTDNGTYATPNGYTLPTSGAATGTYQWMVTYSGDSNNNGKASVLGTEPVVVRSASPSVITSASPSNATLLGDTPPTLKDSATLSGGYHETGTLTFTLYAPDGTTVVDTEAVNLTGDGTYTTPVGYTLPTSGAVTGTYQWVVSYSGDANNRPAASAKGDEPVGVQAAGPVLSTATNPAQVAVGASPFNDSATLTGGYHPGGTLTFTLYASDGTTLLYTDHVSVTGNGVYSTTSGDNPGGYVPSATGTYQWVVSYSGDGNNNPATSGLGDEQVLATASPSFLTTSQAPSSVTLSGAGVPTLKDSATLDGGYSPTGTLTFRLYAPDGTTVVDTETVNVTGDGTYATPDGYDLPTSGAVTGTYQWVASYSGDPNNNPAASAMGDESVVIKPAAPSVSTTADPSSVALSGASVPAMKDSATLAGGYSPTGTLTFRLYAPDGTTVVDTETVNVTGDGTYATPNGYALPTSGAVTGTYQWMVTYSGDANNSPAASALGSEPVTVAPASPRLSTVTDPSHVTLSNVGVPTLKDSAALVGGYHEAGTMTFTLYAPDGTTVVDTETVNVTGDGTYATPNGYTLPTSGAVTGTYQWVVAYSGDANNSPAASALGSEPVTVAPATPQISTSQDPTSVTLSGSGSPTLKDSATLAGGYSPTGTLTFRLYAPDGTTVVDTETVNVTGNGTYATPSGYTLPTSGAVTGTYQWMVSYSGDANNAAATNELGDEAVTVAAAGPRIGTTASPSDLRLDGSGTPMLTDSATLAGGYSPTGTLTFRLYAPDGTTVVDTETVNVTANGTYATPNGYALPTSGAVTGTYQWMVTYSGDANNKPVASAMGDEPVAVEAAFPTLSTSASPTDAALSNGGSPTLKDSATLAGGYNPTGTLTFRLYAPDGTTVVDTETVNVTDNGTYATPNGYTLPTSGAATGTYQWMVTYSGDSNNNGKASVLGTEPIVVRSASPSVITSASPSNATLLGDTPPTLKDSATLSGGYHETGTLTFTLYCARRHDGGGHRDGQSVTGDGTYTTPVGYTLPTSAR